MINDNLGRKVHYLHTVMHNGASIKPDGVLTGALNMCKEVVVIGREHDGKLYVASSHGDADRLIGLIENGKRVIENCLDGDD